MHIFYKLCPKDAVCQISEHLDFQFMRRNLLKFTTFDPFLPAPLYFANLNPYSSKMLPNIWLKSVPWFWKRSRLKEKFIDGRTVPDHYSSHEPLVYDQVS